MIIKKKTVVFAMLLFILMLIGSKAQSAYANDSLSQNIKVRIFTLIQLNKLRVKSSDSSFLLTIHKDNKGIVFTRKLKNIIIYFGQYNKIMVKEKKTYLYKGKWTSIEIKNSSSSAIYLGNQLIDPRPYHGSFRITKRESKYSKWTKEYVCINTITLGEYIKSVVAAEMGDISKSIESLKAQAVVSRSFALSSLKRHLKEGFHFCDTTHCQVYLGSKKANPKVIKAINETEGQVLGYKGQIVPAYFHSTCGGKTTSPRYVWGTKDQDYIIGIEDRPKDGEDYCKDSPHYEWVCYIRLEKLMSIFFIKDDSPRTLQFSRIIYDKSGRVMKMVIKSRSERKTIRGESFRIAIGRNLGWNQVKSNFFKIQSMGRETLTIKGNGLGHGLGLCQYGAVKMADLGMDYKVILKHYFPKCEIIGK